ncbi:MAG: C2 family cysteine protease [Candidatus Eremiobacteraeota bacterium]|nr:C2 family cysteine protease [Candidatus Eremiobacteraeota bacterium]
MTESTVTQVPGNFTQAPLHSPPQGSRGEAPRPSAGLQGAAFDPVAAFQANSFNNSVLSHIERLTTMPRAGLLAPQGASATPPPPTGAPPTTFSQTARSNFAQWDTNHDGSLSREELQNAIVSSSNRGDNAAALSTLYTLYDKIRSLYPDGTFVEGGVSLNDLSVYEHRNQNSPNDDTTSSINGRFSSMRAQIAGQSRQVFANGAPNPEAIQQGYLGDCYFIAPLYGLCRNNPQAVRNMITDNGNGTYTVRLPGRDPATVSTPTDAEIAIYACAGADGLWLAIIEKAYGQTINNGAWFSTSTIPAEAADGGGLIRTGLGAVTGHGVDVDWLWCTRYGTTRNKLQEALQNGRVITAATVRNPSLRGIAGNHAYAITGHNADTNRIRFRNPWGFGGEPTNAGGQAQDGSNDGIFEISMEDFYANFTAIGYDEGS